MRGAGSRRTASAAYPLYAGDWKVVRRMLGTGDSYAVAREETEYVSRLSTPRRPATFNSLDE